MTDAAGTSRGQRQVAHLRPQFNGVQAGACQPSGDLDGSRDRHVDEVRTAVEGLVADGGQPLGQDDAPQRRGILEGSGPDRRRPRGHGRLAGGTRGRIADQGPHGQVVVVERAVIDNERGVGGADAEGGEVIVLSQGVVSEGVQGCTDVERGQGWVLREGLLGDG